MSHLNENSVRVLRSELNNIRKQIVALGHQHRKDVENINQHLTYPSDVFSNKCVAAESSTYRSSLENEGSVTFNPIGFFESCHDSKNGSPRQPTVSPHSCGTLSLISMAPRFNNPHYALENISDFSHVWIIFVFHKNQPGFAKTKVAPPRLDGQRVGIFSTRSPHRPNPIGLTLAKIDSVEKNILRLSGIDLISGTPVLDIKPYIQKYDDPKIHYEMDNNDHPEDVVKVAEWITTKTNLKVTFTTRALEMLNNFPVIHLKHFKDTNDLKAAISDVLSNDPRSTYRRERCSDKLYYFDIDHAHVTAWFDTNNGIEIAEVLKVEPKSNLQQ